MCTVSCLTLNITEHCNDYSDVFNFVPSTLCGCSVDISTCWLALPILVLNMGVKNQQINFFLVFDIKNLKDLMWVCLLFCLQTFSVECSVYTLHSSSVSQNL